MLFGRGVWGLRRFGTNYDKEPEWFEGLVFMAQGAGLMGSRVWGF